MLRTTLLLVLQWFVTAMVFYGISFYASNVLPGNPYLKLGIMGTVRLISYPLQFLALKRFGVRNTLLISHVIFAATMLALAFTKGDSKLGVWIIIVLVSLGQMISDSAFTCVYIFT